MTVYEDFRFANYESGPQLQLGKLNPELFRCASNEHPRVKRAKTS